MKKAKGENQPSVLKTILEQQTEYALLKSMTESKTLFFLVIFSLFCFGVFIAFLFSKIG